ncbi:MAG: OmpA family protein [Bacteroidales bacterium]|nr:OmpA family protein [Bacteroidales bacterium]
MDKSTEKQFKKARELQKSGKKSEAIAIYNDLLDEDPNWLEVNYYLGLSYYLPIEMADFYFEKKDNAQKAIDAFKRMYDVCPYYKAQANLYGARLAYLLEDFATAKMFATVIVENPDLAKNMDWIEEAELIIKKSAFYDKLLHNPVPFEPQPVEGISTNDDEYLATLSPDAEFFYFTRRSKVKSTDYFNESYTDKEFFSYSKKQKNGHFSTGEPLPYPFNQEGNEGSPAINLSNDFLVFSKVTYITLKNGQKYPNYDLYYSEFRNDEWTEPQSLGEKINLPNSWESQPSLSSNGRILFFASDRPGGYGGSDIWFSERNSDGSWRAPKNLGPTINTPGNERSPFLHTDSKTLYFSSSGHSGMGGLDIFYSKLDEKDNWEKPVNIGYPINSENDEVDFFVSLDGETAYFSSNNIDNKDWNIYQFALYEEARPHAMIIIKGEVNDEFGSATDAIVEIRDTASNIIATTTVNEINGKYAIATEIDEEKPQDLIVNIKKEGHAYDTKLVKIDGKSNNVVTSNAEMKKVEVGKTYDLHDIYFATNSYTLNAQAKSIIDLFIEFLKENPTIKTEIQGHTDDVGNDKDNQILSERRAEAVYKYAISKGISSERLRYKGYGETQPIAPNTTPEGRAKNRRTIFLIYET